jgi:hypothetical protein
MPIASALAFQSMMTSLRAGEANNAAAKVPVSNARKILEGGLTGILDAGFIDALLQAVPGMSGVACRPPTSAVRGREGPMKFR